MKFNFDLDVDCGGGTSINIHQLSIGIGMVDLPTNPSLFARRAYVARRAYGFNDSHENSRCALANRARSRPKLSLSQLSNRHHKLAFAKSITSRLKTTGVGNLFLAVETERKLIRRSHSYSRKQRNGRPRPCYFSHVIVPSTICTMPSFKMRLLLLGAVT